MPFLIANLVKVGFVIAVYGFLWYVARAIRTHIAAPAGGTSQPRGSAPPAAPSTLPPPVLVITDGVDNEVRHDLGARTTVGRGVDVDLRIDDEYASERHAAIEVSEGTVWLEDLGSTNGTMIDGQPVSERIEVARGRTITVGRTKMVVR